MVDGDPDFETDKSLEIKKQVIRRHLVEAPSDPTAKNKTSEELFY